MEDNGLQRHQPTNTPTTPTCVKLEQNSPQSRSPRKRASVDKENGSVANLVRNDDVTYDVMYDDGPIDFSVKRSLPLNGKNDVKLTMISNVINSSTGSPLLNDVVKSEQEIMAATISGVNVMPGARYALDSLLYSRLSLSGLSMTSSNGTMCNQAPSTGLNQQQAEALAAAQIQMLMMADNKRRQLLQLQAMAARVHVTPPSSSVTLNINNNHISSDSRISLPDMTSGGETLPADVHTMGRKRGRTLSQQPGHPVDMVDSDDTKSVTGDSSGRDSSYLERRRKNNEAAKRSRDARRAKEEEVALKACVLEEENKQLRVEMASLKQEINRLKQLLFMCQVPLTAPTSAPTSAS